MCNVFNPALKWYLRKNYNKKRVQTSYIFVTKLTRMLILLNIFCKYFCIHACGTDDLNIEHGKLLQISLVNILNESTSKCFVFCTLPKWRAEGTLLLLLVLTTLTWSFYLFVQLNQRFYQLSHTSIFDFYQFIWYYKTLDYFDLLPRSSVFYCHFLKANFRFI